MATHILGFIAKDDFNATNGVAPDNTNGLTVGGTSWGAQPPADTVISFDYTTISTVGVESDYPEFTDDPYNPEWSPNSTWESHKQENASEITINGTTYAPGTLQLENEYEFSLLGSDGKEYRMVAISARGVDNTPGAWYPSGPELGVIGFTFQGDWPPEGVELTFQSNEDGQSLPWENFVPVSKIPCFARGTMIRTVNGYVAVEDLAVGDLVITKDHGPQPVRWIGSKKLSRVMLLLRENLRPVRIRAGALGDGMPSSDLLVSPQHRILVRSGVAQQMFETNEVLAPAKQLLQVDGIDIANDVTEVEYFHVLFDQHEIVMSNGAETESFYTGKQALEAVGAEAREEIFDLFPQLRESDVPMAGARMLLSGREARKLTVRIKQSNRALVTQ